MAVSKPRVKLLPIFVGTYRSLCESQNLRLITTAENLQQEAVKNPTYPSR